MNKKIVLVLTAVFAFLFIFVISAGAQRYGEDAQAEEQTELQRAVNDAYCLERGDVDFDGRVTSADARLILRFAVKVQDPGENERIFGDLDNDLDLTASDARMALRISVKLEKGVSHVSEEEFVLASATCYDVGITANKCLYCGDMFDFGVIPQKKHTGAGWDTVSFSTCSEAGIKEMRCVYCGMLMQTEELPKSSHIFGAVQYVDVRDCTRMREVYRECVNCGYKEYEILLPGAHSYALSETLSPTCTGYGYKEEVCSVCGTKKPDGAFELMPPLGHDVPLYWTVSLVPTATEDGERVKYCSRCGEPLEKEVIPRTGGTPETSEEE